MGAQPTHPFTHTTISLCFTQVTRQQAVNGPRPSNTLTCNIRNANKNSCRNGQPCISPFNIAGVYSHIKQHKMFRNASVQAYEWLILMTIYFIKISSYYSHISHKFCVFALIERSCWIFEQGLDSYDYDRMGFIVVKGIVQPNIKIQLFYVFKTFHTFTWNLKGKHSIVNPIFH